MEGFVFSDADRRQMDVLGIAEAQARDQLEVLRRSSFFVRLNRPCTLGDGVCEIGEEEANEYLQLHEKSAWTGRFVKFVPASGAATRMFQSLLQIFYVPQFLEGDELLKRSKQGVAIACDFVRFVNDLEQFAFVDDLDEALRRDGVTLSDLLDGNHYYTLLEYLLMGRGLNYGSLPKALLKFHKYPGECRTAFQEHLVEATQYVACGAGNCHVHFTVSPEHHDGFMRLYEEITPSLEREFGIQYEVSFSYQKTSTNTIAAGMDDHPFRDRSGQLHFRPGGHGALLENLSDLNGDLVYVKNVDNLVQDRHKPEVVYWKRLLGGALSALQSKVHGFLRQLTEEPSQKAAEETFRFAREELLIHFPDDFERWRFDAKCEHLIGKLDRPIRVAGVVRNLGEPGGAPFWVEGKEGSLSLQIVEKAQVDHSDPDQREIWMSSTHFNPVDIVCGVRDHRGKPFDLARYVDDAAVLISKKSREGRELKALELPGLWNGSMAGWITVIVEVPNKTFNPVKTVFDLLRPEHQMNSCAP